MRWVSAPPDQHEVMAEIFNFFDRTTEASFLEMLGGEKQGVCRADQIA